MNENQNGEDEIIEDSEEQMEQEAEDISATEHSNTESEIQEMREEQQIEAEIRDLENQRKNGSKNFIEQGQIRNYEDKLRKQLQDLKEKHSAQSLIRAGRQVGHAGVKVVRGGAEMAQEAYARYQAEQRTKQLLAQAAAQQRARPVQARRPQPQRVEVHQPGQQVQPQPYEPVHPMYQLTSQGTQPFSQPMPFQNQVYGSSFAPTMFGQSVGMVGQPQVQAVQARRPQPRGQGGVTIHVHQPGQRPTGRRVVRRRVQPQQPQQPMMPFGGWTQQRSEARPAARGQRRVKPATMPFMTSNKKGKKPKGWL